MLRNFLVATVFACTAFAALAGDSSDCRTKLGDVAIAACNRIINDRDQSRDERGNALIARGQHYYEVKDYDRAIKDFNDAIPLKPSYIDMAYGNRGNVYYMRGENSAAIDSYTRAIELNAEYPAALAARGLLYEKAGELKKARADFVAALDANSKYADTKWAHETARKGLDRLNNN